MKVKFIEFLKKYKYLILGYILFGILFFYIKPTQKEYYFESDINNFDNNYYLSFSFYSILFLLITVAIISIVRKIKIKNILINLLGTIIFASIFLIFCHSSILSIVLLGNKIKSVGNETRHYKITTLTNNKFLFAINLHKKDDIFDEEDYTQYFDKNEFKNLKVGDTLNLEMQKGIFGINYINK